MKTAFERTALVLLGFGIAVFVMRVKQVTWDDTIHIADILNFVVTVIIAVFVAEIVRGRSEVSKAERDLLVQYLNEALGEASEIRRMFSRTFRGEGLTQVESGDLVTRFRHINNLLYLVQQVGTRSGRLGVATVLGKPKEKAINYKIVVTGGLSTLGEKIRNRHDNAYQELREEFAMAICDIHKS